MAADANNVTAADIQRVSEVDFVSQFTSSLNAFMQLLGVYRKVEKVPGQKVAIYKTSGTLQDGAVAEGEDIPLSKYTKKKVKELTLELKKHRKATTIEAINEAGYSQAVVDTDTALLKDIQGVIRGNFASFMEGGTGTAEGVGLRAALAQTSAKLADLWKDEGLTESDMVYLVNSYDAADYLADKGNYATMSEQMGMVYLTKFLGLYNVLVTPLAKKGSVKGTAVGNLVLYYLNPANADIKQAFDFTTDESGFIGVHHDANYVNLTNTTVALYGIGLYAELIDRVVLGSIKAEAAGA
jgi:hypothetical protein